jgi:hypothetical protein
MKTSNKLIRVVQYMVSISITFYCVKEPVAPAEADHQGKEKPVFDQVRNRKNTLFLKRNCKARLKMWDH